jgi:hypothetical protein
VTAVSPNTWWCWKVFKSACNPAPAEQSDPAMLNATGGDVFTGGAYDNAMIRSNPGSTAGGRKVAIG